MGKYKWEKDDALHGILLFTYYNVIIFFQTFMQNSRMAYRGKIYVKSTNKTAFCLSKNQSKDLYQ